MRYTLKVSKFGSQNELNKISPTFDLHNTQLFKLSFMSHMRECEKSRGGGGGGEGKSLKCKQFHYAENLYSLSRSCYK